MGLYLNLFYGGIVKNINKDSLKDLENVCKENGWTLERYKDVFIVHSNSNRIGLDTFRRFNSDSLTCNYEDESGELKVVKAGKEIYDKLAQNLSGFDFDPRWIRSTFYSGNMTNSYDTYQE